jgi:ATP-dependent exoDNAse (exonuclease V) alpha subunit
MELTKCQQKGLEMVRRLHKAKNHQVAVLGGHAGSGKTTLLKIIAEELGHPLIICPTGKAAARVTEATGLGAMTCHRWLYKPTTNQQTGLVEFVRLPPENMDVGECGVLIIDEASMVTRAVWDDILDISQILGLKVLCVGDAFQLPPVDEKNEGFSLLDPNAGIASEYVLMTEVLRQAADSPVIRASIQIRNGDVQGALMTLMPWVPPNKFIERAASIQSKGGMVLCHKNTTRHWVNKSVRKERGFSEKNVQVGEPVLVLKNAYDLSIYNGETYSFGGWEDLSIGEHTVYDRWSKVRETTQFGVAYLKDDKRNMSVKGAIAQEELLGNMKNSTAAIAASAKIVCRGVSPIHANLGYCLSVHKSQGSEAPEVLLAWEPTLNFNGYKREEALRFAYTAITRAKERCWISLGATAPAI